MRESKLISRKRGGSHRQMQFENNRISRVISSIILMGNLSRLGEETLTPLTSLRCLSPLLRHKSNL